MRLQNNITQKRLQELLSYDPKTGLFINLTQRSGNAKKGNVAGCVHPKGYIAIVLDGKKYLAHRLAWLYVYGNFPEKDLDHVDETPSNNRISNLRLATNQENQHNRSNPSINNKSGFRGVSWGKKLQKWRARIKLNETYKHLGYFNTAEEAYEAYLTAKRLYHPFWVEKKVA